MLILHGARSVMMDTLLPDAAVIHIVGTLVMG